MKCTCLADNCAILFTILGDFLLLFSCRYDQIAADLISVDFEMIHEHGKDGVAHKFEDSAVANGLFTDLKILCYVMTSPQHHQTRAKHVQQTWGSRCNKLIFLSSSADPSINSHKLVMKKGWGRSREALKYLYRNFGEQYDWYVRADDDTYVIVENLRYLLYPFSKTDIVSFGYKMDTDPFVRILLKSLQRIF